ncbi:DUF928 domain-containing protein [Tychonema bourrellyi FEM_GT703]|uniref:DUF928 domain-containing protein n=2 Tax=Tychonema bourrellyi TaxID=54313 RepID=A0A2G4F5N9_9CYAN|nr:DUF928 domain-containing protein [Tychonema bourrellyi FEM_GT703]
MAWIKCHLNTAALCLILSLEAVATASFSMPAEALNNPANGIRSPDIPHLTVHWATVSRWINRTASAPTLKTKLDRSSKRDRLTILTQQAIWYKYLTTLAQLRVSSPSDRSLSRCVGANRHSPLQGFPFQHQGSG